MKEILIPLNFSTSPTVYDTKQSFSASDEESDVLTFTTTADVVGTVASLTIRNASENANRQTVLIDRLDVNTSPFSYTFRNPLPFGQYEGTVLLKKNLTVIASASFLFGVNSSLSAEVLPDLVKAYALDELVENVETEVSNLKDAFTLTVSETVKGVNKTESSLQAQENVRYLNEHQRKANELERIANENARIAAELERKDTFDTLVDSEVIEQTVVQEVAEKYQEIEALNAPEMVSFRQQLAEADDNIKNISAPYKYTGAMATIIIDDGDTLILTNQIQTLDAKGVKATFPIITQWVGATNNMTVAQLLALQADGHEIVSHTKTHSTVYFRDSIASTPDSVYETEFGDSKQFLIDNGFKGYDTLVYAYGSFGANAPRLKALASKYYTNAVNANGPVSVSPIDNMMIGRIMLKQATAIETIYGYIDDGFANNKWLVFGMHSGDVDATYLSNVIDYLQSKNIPIKTFGEAVKIKGNALSLGEYTETGKGVFFGLDGKIKITGAGFNAISGTNVKTMDAPITDFLQYQLSSFQISSAYDTLSTKGGNVFVYRGDQYYSYEMFFPSDGLKMYFRTWNETTSLWNAWQDLSAYTVKWVSSMDAAITTFENKRLTYLQMGPGSDTFLGVGGILETFRGDAGFSFQRFYPLGTEAIYRRIWNDGGSSWGAWGMVGVPRSGTTTQRQAVTTTTLKVGQSYFDTTLGKPLWVKSISPTVWVDSAGTITA